jgi:hypothetical protein
LIIFAGIAPIECLSRRWREGSNEPDIFEGQILTLAALAFAIFAVVANATTPSIPIPPP